uniref:Small heat shock protein n=1 Tax=Dastarcus helophoroides TaxID=1169899 RepID=A0A166IKZ4_9CUCU|nr:small heat shock protein [Dastarcus helophoroides]
MSLLPLLLDDFVRPSRLLDQHFGLVLDPEDLISPLTLPRDIRQYRQPFGYLRPWRSAASHQDTGSTVSVDKDKFTANLDVQQFKPEEITVKATGDNVITIEGKHEEKQDEHGYISRHFVRRYVLPKGCDIGKVESKLSSDGVLTVTAPKVNLDKVDHREIPITQTGEPMKTIEKKENQASGEQKK